MKLLFLTLLTVVVYSAPRSKRSLFGSAPCVVTGNSLYINGLYQRNLSSNEMSELNQYQDSVSQYENTLQAAIDQRKQDRMNGRNGGQRGNNQSGNSQMMTSLPQPPSRPSFCGDDAITQYIFDGCLVQDNKVYIGRQYARDLSPTEIQQLQDYDSQMTNYQDYLQQQVQNQLSGLFGQGFLSQFSDDRSTTMPTSTGATSSPGPAPQLPTPPNFCTTIY